MKQPEVCDPRAYHHLAAQLPRMGTTAGLLHAAVAVSMHFLDDIDADEVEAEVGEIAGRVRRRVRSDSSEAKIAHLHDEFFDQLGFSGNRDDYYEPGNSLLPVVLATRTGIPISLSLLYVLVARRVGIKAEGVNSPGHFMVRVQSGHKPMLVDPFFGGRVLSTNEAIEWIERTTDQSLAKNSRLLAAASHSTWITRMLYNLMNAYTFRDDQVEVAAIQELLALVAGDTTC